MNYLKKYHPHIYYGGNNKFIHPLDRELEKLRMLLDEKIKPTNKKEKN